MRLTTFQCGNGQIDPAETRDDGNFDAGDGCDPCCLTECGNGRIDGDEACDDGNLASNDDCTDQCVEARRGDGIIWLGNEECDDGDANRDAPGLSAGPIARVLVVVMVFETPARSVMMAICSMAISQLWLPTYRTRVYPLRRERSQWTDPG